MPRPPSGVVHARPNQNSACGLAFRPSPAPTLRSCVVPGYQPQHLVVMHPPIPLAGKRGGDDDGVVWRVPIDEVLGQTLGTNDAVKNPSRFRASLLAAGAEICKAWPETYRSIDVLAEARRHDHRGRATLACICATRERLPSRVRQDPRDRHARGWSQPRGAGPDESANVVREDLKEGEKAAAMKQLRDWTGWSFEAIADRMGLSVNRVQGYGRCQAWCGSLPRPAGQ